MTPSPEIAFQRRNKGTGVQVQLGQTADLQPQVVQGGLNFYQLFVDQYLKSAGWEQSVIRCRNTWIKAKCKTWSFAKKKIENGDKQFFKRMTKKQNL